MSAQMLLQFGEVVVDLATCEGPVFTVSALDPLATYKLICVQDIVEFEILAVGNGVMEPDEPHVEIFTVDDGHQFEGLDLIVFHELICEAVLHPHFWDVLKLFVEMLDLTVWKFGFGQ